MPGKTSTFFWEVAMAMVAFSMVWFSSKRVIKLSESSANEGKVFLGVFYIITIRNNEKYGITRSLWAFRSGKVEFNWGTLQGEHHLSTTLYSRLPCHTLLINFNISSGFPNVFLFV